MKCETSQTVTKIGDYPLSLVSIKLDIWAI